MKKKVDIDQWNRKAHFHFFKGYDNPFYNICCNIDITDLLNSCRSHNKSFFLASLYFSTKAANCVNELKYRLEGEDVYEYETIHPFSTILNDDNTFGFCKFNLCESYSEFESNGKRVILETKENKNLLPKDERLDVIHFTTIPWIEITSVSHARKFKTGDSIPKMVFGKYFKNNDRTLIPFSIEVHHSLLDGYHIALFLDKFSEFMSESDNILNS